MQLRRLAWQLEARPPSPERDELLTSTRLRIVDIEASDELGPPSPHPALQRASSVLTAGTRESRSRQRRELKA